MQLKCKVGAVMCTLNGYLNCRGYLDGFSNKKYRKAIAYIL